MRYSGGLLGGSWLTALTSDVSAGKFDGAWLVMNFEALNPSNTLWTKQYNLYSKIDRRRSAISASSTIGAVMSISTRKQFKFIFGQLFIGNNLAARTTQTSDGEPLDLRKIRSPIVAFCSEGDNITPPASSASAETRSTV